MVWASYGRQQMKKFLGIILTLIFLNGCGGSTYNYGVTPTPANKIAIFYNPQSILWFDSDYFHTTDAAIRDARTKCQVDDRTARADHCYLYQTSSNTNQGAAYETINHWENQNKAKWIASQKKPSSSVAKKPEGELPGTKTPEKITYPPKTKKESPKQIIKKSPEIDPSLITIGSGSGFYINNQGYALTNNHVIDICKQSVAIIDGRETLFRVIATDKTNDVAVLKTDFRSRNYIRINEDGAELGESIIAVGYPLAGRLSDSVKITRGIVSSLSGLNNNIGQIQIDAALQPGNSGGPVLNESGELVGIASAGLNKLLMAKEAKYIPENVNFAVASPIVTNILKSKKVKYSSSGIFSGSYTNTELASLGNKSTIQLFCRNTRVAYNRLKSSNKYTSVLLDLE